MALVQGERVLRKVIFTAAITGAGPTPDMSPYLPITPQQIADEAVRAYEAGAAIVHIHARDPETGRGTPDLKIFRQILESIHKRCDVVVCITTGGAGDRDQRIAVVPEFKPELATLNLGSLNTGSQAVARQRAIQRATARQEGQEQRTGGGQEQRTGGGQEQRAGGGEDGIWMNTYKMMRDYATFDKQNNTKPELEVWDTGQLRGIKFLLDNELIDKPLHIQYVMGGLTGMYATPSMLLYILQETKEQLGSDFTWSVAAVGKDQFMMAAMALCLGGNVRVGIEDSLYCGVGRLARGNYEQVERVVKMAEQMSMVPATPTEARQMLGLKGGDKVNF